MIWSSLAKFLIGISLALALVIGSGVATAVYFINKATVPPPKPIFATEKKRVKARPPSPRETPALKPLEPGAYRARVTWSEGLLLRSKPNLDAERIGGVGYNQRIVVLEESADKTWQQVRLEDSELQGWIKAGNTERIK